MSDTSDNQQNHNQSKARHICNWCMLFRRRVSEKFLKVIFSQVGTKFK